jgi:hypothetical protein
MSLQAATALFKAAMFSILLHNHKQNVRFLAASCNSCKRPYTYSRLAHTRHLDHSKTHKTNANRPKSPLPKKPKTKNSAPFCASNNKNTNSFAKHNCCNFLKQTRVSNFLQKRHKEKTTGEGEKKKRFNPMNRFVRSDSDHGCDLC